MEGKEMDAPETSAAAAETPGESKPEDAQKKENTISNLPLLFANGYPTSLEKITETQLGKFIPFMVQCSLGNVQPTTPLPDHSTAIAGEGGVTTPTPAQTIPPWWPDDIPYALPLVQPTTIAKVRRTHSYLVQ